MNIVAVGKTIVVELDEEYSSLNSPLLAKTQHELFVALAANDEPRVIFDMSRTRFFGSEFLEMLFRIWHRANQKGGHFAVAGAQSSAYELLQVTHLDKLWPTFPTVKEALASFPP